LPGTRVEASAIERYMGRGRSTLLQDAAATEAQVRGLSGDRAVLHFATHAVIREDKPFESELLLAASGIDSASDGRLTAAEIYELRLHADLIVLSACRSAAGGVAGDAIAAFTRAFLYAGTATLVASVWDVADEPTNRLVPAFYRAWLDGAEKAAALRSAQLHLLQDLRAGRVKVTTELGPVMLTEHPVFWAGFLLFGEPR
jgi:CHAT domain-containing protein